jgi:hypothetical protein
MGDGRRSQIEGRTTMTCNAVRWIVLVLGCWMLAACGSVKTEYNSPLGSPGTGALPETEKRLFGHWTGGTEKDVNHLYVGKMRLLGSDQHGDRHERFLIVFMNPDKPSGWEMTQAHTTTIKDASFLNISDNLFGKGEGWVYKLVEVSEDGETLTLRDVGIFDEDEFRSSGFLAWDDDNEGASVARYIKRLGHESLLEGSPKVYWRTPKTRPE